MTTPSRQSPNSRAQKSANHLGLEVGSWTWELNEALFQPRRSSAPGMHLEMGVAAESAHRNDRRALPFCRAQLCSAVFPHTPRGSNHVANAFIGGARAQQGTKIRTVAGVETAEPQAV